MHLVERAHAYLCDFTELEPFSCLNDYIVAVRTARRAVVQKYQAQFAAHEP